MTIEKVHRFVTNDLSIRAASVNATAVVAQMQKLQATLPLPTVAVGRTMVGAILMASQLKEGQEIGILVKANGPIASVFAQANFNGHVRGYTSSPLYEPYEYPPHLSLKEAINGGFLTVVRHQPFQRQPYQGTVELVSGEIGDDLAYYLHQSQQIRSIISLGVYLDTFGKVKSAGGVIVEVMPGVEDEVVEKLEANYSKNKSEISKMILDGEDPETLVKQFLDGFLLTNIPHEHKVEYSCPCNRDRVKGALTVLGIAELDDIIAKQEVAHITCQMCGRPYDLTPAEVLEIRQALFKSSLH
jgi:molecular chaperone Hsp33